MIKGFLGNQTGRNKKVSSTRNEGQSCNKSNNMSTTCKKPMNLDPTQKVLGRYLQDLVCAPPNSAMSNHKSLTTNSELFGHYFLGGVGRLVRDDDEITTVQFTVRAALIPTT